MWLNTELANGKCSASMKIIGVDMPTEYKNNIYFNLKDAVGGIILTLGKTRVRLNGPVDMGAPCRK